jgi:hypothetical protein
MIAEVEQQFDEPRVPTAPDPARCVAAIPRVAAAAVDQRRGAGAAAGIDATGVDARKVIVTDDHTAAALLTAGPRR